jgi:hypothetical protein
MHGLTKFDYSCIEPPFDTRCMPGALVSGKRRRSGDCIESERQDILGNIINVGFS